VLYLDNYSLKDEIINFVQNAPEEMNARVAVFIAGMQAQKSLMDYRRKTSKRLSTKTVDGLSGAKTHVS
jgi:hypothetical protein